MSRGKKLNAKARAELEKLREDNGGLLDPHQVVKHAKNKKTELHRHFEWDSDKAAYEHNLNQARQLITTFVEVIKVGDGEPIETQAYVSLATDRINGGGYRQTIAVMSDPALRDVLLRQAIQDLNRLRRKYAELEELASIFAAIDDTAPSPRRGRSGTVRKGSVR